MEPKAHVHPDRDQFAKLHAISKWDELPTSKQVDPGLLGYTKHRWDLDINLPVSWLELKLDRQKLASCTRLSLVGTNRVGPWAPSRPDPSLVVIRSMHGGAANAHDD